MAPSSVKSKPLKVIGTLLAHSFLDARSLDMYLDGKKEAGNTYDEKIGKDDKQISDVCSSLQKKILHTLHIRTKESSTSAYHDLFYFMAYMFSDLMDKTVFVDFQFSVWETKRSGPDYASDVALAMDMSEFPLEGDLGVVALQEESLGQSLLGGMPLVIFEIKPQLQLDPLPADALAECLLQAYYCLSKFHMTKSLFCLTDFKIWNYFEVEVMPTDGNSSPLINIIKSSVFLNKDIFPSLPELKKNLQYLVHVCLEDE